MPNIPPVEKILRHRYPFLFVDKITELEKGKRAKGIKCVSVNEAFFAGHFPGRPIMPGVLIIEALAQVSAAINTEENLMGLLTSVYEAKFFKPVIPGDVLVLESEVIQKVKELVRVRASAKVADKVVAKAELGFIIHYFT